MPYKKREIICEQCHAGFMGIPPNKFCSRRCSGIHSIPSQRPISDLGRQKLSENLSERWQNEEYRAHMSAAQTNRAPETRPRGEKHSKSVGESTRGRYVQGDITSLWLVSSRTRTKILTRLKLACSNCGWNECPCDIHHINGRKIENPHHHSNLSYLCPNCHRKAHHGLLKTFINLEQQIGDIWKTAYYG